MKVAIAASQSHLQSEVDTHFGRCAWFCIFDTQGRTHEFVENPYREREGEAGSLAAGLLAEQGAAMVVAGRFGSKAMQALRGAGIQMILPEKRKSVHEMIQLIK